MNRTHPLGPAGHLASDVLSGKTRSVPWGQVAIVFPADDPQETWAALRAWAEEHGIRYSVREQVTGRRQQLWVDLAPKS